MSRRNDTGAARDFIVRGARKSDGQPVEIKVHAQDAERAERTACDLGVLVSKVSYAGSAPARDAKRGSYNFRRAVYIVVYLIAAFWAFSMIVRMVEGYGYTASQQYTDLFVGAIAVIYAELVMLNAR